jgi:hypothetical protein
MTATSERAFRAKRLRDDEGFNEFMEAVRAEQVAVFLDIAAPPEARERAHGIIRALAAIEGTLAAAIGAETVEQKRKGQHRGSD